MTTVFKPLVAALSLTLAAATLPALAEAPAIKTINGVASYPDGYQGTPVRAADEDPFLSPSNAALILIDYQPPILMGVRNIDHEELVNNTTGLIKTAVIFDIPIIFSHVAVGLNGYDPMIEAGVEPITWNVVPAELQRDHARSDQLQAVTRVFMEHLFKVDPDSTW
ncbi:hypothetical protein [uncultured Shimia sp.]|uniref:hypothetical protein n=1 Tax=uncultured Shimia sp. TaxID=573152 RepID=UPI0025E400CC|nr:hypothetical protein [uncultured Shimia sp.]